MKILLISQNYYPCIGGIETLVRLVGHELAKTHQVNVVAVNFAPCQLPQRLKMLHTSLMVPFYDSYADESIYVHALTPNWFDRLRMLPIAMRAIPRLQRYAYHPLKRLGYKFYYAVYAPRLRQLMQGMDIVHCFALDYLGWAAQAVAQELGIPFVCSPHVHPPDWGTDADNVAYQKKCQAIVAITETDRQFLLALGLSEAKLHIIGNAADLPPSSDPVDFRQRNALEGIPVILYVGRMVAHKGAKAVLTAAQKVWQIVPEAQFVFIGPIDENSKNWFENTDPRILYLGAVSNQEKADALAACDIFCMPSVSELFGIVYLEAWNYSKPVIGGNTGVLPELIAGNRAGMNVEQNPEEISAAINQLLMSPELREYYGKNGKSLLEENYTVQKIAEKHIQLYRSLLTNQSLMESRVVEV